MKNFEREETNMDTAIITAIITAVTTLVVSMGTWHVSMKQMRKKDQDELKALIESYRKELHNKMEELDNNVIQVNASVQQQIAIIELKIDTLSDRVEKHNGVIERTYALEKTTTLQGEKLANMHEQLEYLSNRAEK